jgi:hypothetical protein
VVGRGGVTIRKKERLPEREEGGHRLSEKGGDRAAVKEKLGMELRIAGEKDHPGTHRLGAL